MAKLSWKRSSVGDGILQWVSGDFMIRQNYAESEYKYSFFRWNTYAGEGNSLSKLKADADWLNIHS
jgi:hypothetical protein